MERAVGERILLCGNVPNDAVDIRRALQDAHFGVVGHALGGDDPDDLAGYHTVILDSGPNVAEGLAFCQRLRSLPDDHCLPVLYIANESSGAARQASLESGADAFLPRPFDAAELLAHVRVLLRNKRRHDQMAEKTTEIHRVNRRLQQAYQQIDEELELARRIQESFLPQNLPQVPQVQFAVHYQPSGRVGGDFYDVFRLDEKHVGFYVADAMGHGVPASLLTIFVKTGVKPKEIHGKEYRLVPPHEVLQRLNRDLIQQQLSDTPFITMAYGLLNCQDRSLSFSRSGHPYPLYIPLDGCPELWPVEGGLLGVFDTRYGQRTYQLQAGDKVLFYTDGIDPACCEGACPGAQSLLAFCSKHREKPIAELVRLLPLELYQTSRQTDDLTVLGLEILSPQ